jgi:hypothetical protein
MNTSDGIPMWINIHAALLALLGTLSYAAFGGWEFLLVAGASGLFLLAQPVIWLIGSALEGGA